MLHEETISLFFASNILRFDHCEALSSFLEACEPHSRRIRRLAFGYRNYCPQAFQLLKRCTDLSELTITLEENYVLRSASFAILYQLKGIEKLQIESLAQISNHYSTAFDHCRRMIGQPQNSKEWERVFQKDYPGREDDSWYRKRSSPRTRQTPDTVKRQVLEKFLKTR